MALPKFLFKTSVIVYSLVLGTFFVLTSLAAISLLGTKASAKFKAVAPALPQTPPGSTKPATPSPDTPATNPEPSKTSQ